MKRRTIRGCDGDSVEIDRYLCSDGDEVVNLSTMHEGFQRGNALFTLAAARKLHAALGALLKPARKRGRR